MNDYGVIKSIINIIEEQEPTLQNKVVTQAHSGLAEPYVVLSVLSSSSDRPYHPTRSKTGISVEIVSKYDGIFEITSIMSRLQAILNSGQLINVYGVFILEIIDADIKTDSDGQRRVGRQHYLAKMNLHRAMP